VPEQGCIQISVARVGKPEANDYAARLIRALKKVDALSD
jgi:hypothetical protein